MRYDVLRVNFMQESQYEFVAWKLIIIAVSDINFNGYWSEARLNYQLSYVYILIMPALSNLFFYLQTSCTINYRSQKAAYIILSM